jgi:hypothetical protein
LTLSWLTLPPLLRLQLIELTVLEDQNALARLLPLTGLLTLLTFLLTLPLPARARSQWHQLLRRHLHRLRRRPRSRKCTRAARQIAYTERADYEAGEEQFHGKPSGVGLDVKDWNVKGYAHTVAS